MSTYIQIHTLTSHSTHNLNRDDLGQPKTVTFLGKSHGRISSQCLKRSIRQYLRNTEMQSHAGTRTRQLPRLVKQHLLAHEVPEKLVDTAVVEVASFAKKGKAAVGDELTQLIFLTTPELEAVKAKTLEICQENEGAKLTEAKKLIIPAIRELYKSQKFRDGVDIALFGRMTTSDVFNDCEAAVQVAHAITTHPVKNQDDFFTAVDDLESDDLGAGHMDDKAFNTGIFYKYSSINYPLLRSNLADDDELACQAVLAYLEAFIMALPSGSQNSMAAHQRPFTILVTVGSGANSNLTNAFIDLDRMPPKLNPLQATTQALIQEYLSEQQFYGDWKQIDQAVLACQKPKYLDDLSIDPIHSVGTIGELVSRLKTTLTGASA